MNRQHHIVPEHIITEQLSVGKFLAYCADRTIVKFGHGITRQEAIDELLYKLRKKQKVK